VPPRTDLSATIGGAPCSLTRARSRTRGTRDTSLLACGTGPHRGKLERDRDLRRLRLPRGYSPRAHPGRDPRGPHPGHLGRKPGEPVAGMVRGRNDPNIYWVAHYGFGINPRSRSSPGSSSRRAHVRPVRRGLRTNDLPCFMGKIRANGHTDGLLTQASSSSTESACSGTAPSSFRDPGRDQAES